MNVSFNYYELLGVNQNSTEEEIKQAYKKQMKKWHPDINKTDEAVNMSSKINEAKEVLLDSAKRKDYDEFLKQKINENYNKYTQRKKYQAEENNNQNNKEYQNNHVTKWQYLKEWLKYSNVSIIRKFLGTIGVLIESLLCFLIKLLLIIIAYISNVGSYIIRYIFNYLLPILGIIIAIIFLSIFSDGFSAFMQKNNDIMHFLIINICIYLLSFILPLFSKALLSEKSFDILYNKIDINLFKFCVSYDK